MRALIVISIHILAIVVYKGSRPTALLWIFPLTLIAFYTQGARAGVLYSICLLSSINLIKTYDLLFISRISFITSHYIETNIIFICIIFLTFNSQLILEKKEKQIKKQLYWDELTGLQNRNRLVQNIKQYSIKTLILINIDSFGRINSLIGIEGGDYVLKQTSQRLLKITALYRNSKLFKLSSDEFALLLPGVKDTNSIKKLVDQINAIIKEEIIIDNSSIIITASMGVSSTIEKILTTSDIALKMAKRQKKPYVIYNHTLNIPQLHKQNLLQLYKLQKAIENENIVPFFQPIRVS